MNITYHCEDREGWLDHGGLYDRIYRNEDNGDRGYMRGKWKDIADKTAVHSQRVPETYFQWYETVERLESDKVIYDAVRLRLHDIYAFPLRSAAVLPVAML